MSRAYSRLRIAAGVLGVSEAVGVIPSFARCLTTICSIFSACWSWEGGSVWVVAVFLTRPFFVVSCWGALEWHCSSSWRFLFLVFSAADLDLELSWGCCCGVLWNWGRVAEREGSLGALGVLSWTTELSRRGRSSKDFYALRYCGSKG